MKLAIFGSTGMGGKAALAKAVQRGHQVTILVRKPIDVPSGVSVVIGDARDPAAVRATIAGSDAVIQCLGVGGLGDGKPNSLVPDATALILEEMKAAGQRRIVCMGNVGVPGSGAEFLRLVVVPLFARKLIPIVESKIQMEAILQASELDWTVVRMPALTERPDRKKIRISAEGRAVGMTVTTGDAADFMLDIIENRQFFAAAVSIAN